MKVKIRYTNPPTPRGNSGLGLQLPLPARLEQAAHVEARQGVRLGVPDDLVEWEDVVGGEEEVEVFQCLGLLVF